MKGLATLDDRMTILLDIDRVMNSSIREPCTLSNYSGPIFERYCLLKEALDNSSTCVMVADAEHKIIYLNKAIKTLFRAAQGELRKDPPEFNVERLIGSPLELLAKRSTPSEASS